MQSLRSMLSNGFLLMVGLGVVLLILSGCDDEGDITENPSTIDERNLSAVAGPTDPSQLRPVARVPRDQYGIVSPFPLEEEDVDAFIYPGANAEERAAIMEGLTFFTTPHTPEEGAGPAANQPMCLGCHLSSAEALEVDENGNRIVTTVSQLSRAGRTTPTNFDFTALVLDPDDPDFGGGRAPGDPLGDILGNVMEPIDAITGTGGTAAFTIFGNFSPSSGEFNGLAPFAGFVQHVRPSIEACVPDPILPIEQDPNLDGGIDPITGESPVGLRRAIGERAGPPYIGRGLMEAIFSGNLVANDDPDDVRNHNSSLDVVGDFPECPNDCISGRHNENTSNQAFTGGDPVVRVGRFGLRAAGPTMLQFVVGGVQGELGFTTEFNMTEINDNANVGRPACMDEVSEPEIPVSAVISCRALIRLSAPPEFGNELLALLQSADPAAPRNPATPQGMVQQGAQLFGINLVAFANRMIPNRMPAGGDGLDPNAINQADRLLNCASCHTPIHATGQSPAEVGAQHLSHVWAPIFSDLLLHAGPVINGERIAPAPRLPLLIRRVDAQGRAFNTFDLPRNLADDALPNQGLANGAEFRTAPLMGMGIMGPPYLHDARVYLSRRSVDTTPAGTVFTNSEVTNAPLVVRTLDDAIRAVIELHDLPAPDDANTPVGVEGAGCPVPAGNRHGDVFYFGGANDICPPYDSQASIRNRSEAREVIRRYRALSPADQQALIEFLKQL